MVLDDATVRMLKALVPPKTEISEQGIVVDLDDPIIELLLRALATRAQYLNEVGLEYLISRLKQIYVEKVPGKGLSTNDLTDELLAKINGAATSTEITNVKNELLTLINGMTGFDYKIVSTLPATGEKGILYLVPIDDPSSTINIYEEYIWVDDRFELLGSVEIGFAGNGPFATLTDLANYMPKSGGTFTGNVRFQTGGGPYGSVINIGDGDYIHISEPTDDHLEIKASYINFVVPNTGTGRFTVNGTDILGGDSIAYIRIYNNYFLPSENGTVAATTTRPDGTGIALSAIVTSVKVNGSTKSPNTSGQVDLGTIGGPTTYTGTTTPASSTGVNDDFYYKFS